MKLIQGLVTLATIPTARPVSPASRRDKLQADARGAARASLLPEVQSLEQLQEGGQLQGGQLKEGGDSAVGNGDVGDVRAWHFVSCEEIKHVQDKGAREGGTFTSALANRQVLHERTRCTEALVLYSVTQGAGAG